MSKAINRSFLPVYNIYSTYCRLMNIGCFNDYRLPWFSQSTCGCTMALHTSSTGYHTYTNFPRQWTHCDATQVPCCFYKWVAETSIAQQFNVGVRKWWKDCRLLASLVVPSFWPAVLLSGLLPPLETTGLVVWRKSKVHKIDGGCIYKVNMYYRYCQDMYSYSLTLWHVFFMCPLFAAPLTHGTQLKPRKGRVIHVMYITVQGEKIISSICYYVNRCKQLWDI